MLEHMEIPKTRAEFERRFHLLMEKMRQGNLYFSENTIQGIHGIERIRILPNGRIDFLSVNESARCLVNSMTHFDSERMKAMIDNREDKDATSEYIGEDPAV